MGGGGFAIVEDTLCREISILAATRPVCFSGWLVVLKNILDFHEHDLENSVQASGKLQSRFYGQFT